MGKTSIQWTDETWNPTRGCTKISPGCKHCYAETFAERFRGVKGHPYEQGFDLRLVPDKLDAPLHWKKPRRVFVNSMSDLFHDDVPDEFIWQVFAIMANAQQHTFQILTKRARRMADLLADKFGPFCQNVRGSAFRFAQDGVLPLRRRGEVVDGERLPDVPVDAFTWPLPNVWLGVSVESQEYADARIPHLLRTPAAVRFLSCEPLLGAVDLRRYLACPTCKGTGTVYESHDFGATEELGCQDCMGEKPLHWCIVGGESGASARPCATEWIEGIVSQCRAAGVPAFVKQLGAMPVSMERTAPAVTFGKPPPESMRAPNGEFWAWTAGRNGKWDDPAEWPADLRVREFPNTEWRT